ncbi:MAG: ABC transporter permease, partial [Acidobacteriaceae bacterium]|nr:ABC transporter permease [Acidobacteriaceae bacterium]
EFMFAAEYTDLRHNPGPFQEVSAFEAGAPACDLTEQNPLRLRCMRMEANFVHLLGLNMAAGRMFSSEEDRPNGPRVALISYGLWSSRFQRDPNVAGRVLPIDGVSTTVVGVLPRDFEVPTLTHTDIVLPMALNEATERAGRAFRVFARLKPGITLAQARSQLAPHFARALATVPPQFRKEVSLRIQSVRDRQVGDVKLASWVLFGSVLAVLLIACANIANLLLARATSRDRERAMRIALGASQWRMLRQSLAESVILGVVGGGSGCVLAYVLLRIFLAIAPSALPKMEGARIDWRVLAFALAASILSGILFGIAPAFRRPQAGVVAGWRSTGRSRTWLQTGLVTAQIAISMVLLTGAGLLLRSLWRIENVPMGMQAARVITARFVLPKQKYGQNARMLEFFRELEQRTQSVPGVESAAITDSVPPSGGTRGRPFAAIDVAGRPRMPEGTGGMVMWRYITPGYFAALGIPVVRGRSFDYSDRGLHSNAVILSEALARKLFPSEDPVGKQILKDADGQWATVVGVVGDVRNLGPMRAAEPEYYLLRKQVEDATFRFQEPPTGWRAGVVVARTSIAPRLVAQELRSAIASIDATLPVEIETMEQRVEQVSVRPRFNAVLLVVFAAIGVLLAAVGLFGVTSFLVSQRTREIGVRLALGAAPGQIARLTILQAARWTTGGMVVGAFASFVAMRWLRSLLFQVEPLDPVVILSTITLLFGMAVLAAFAPAVRAARVNPVETLREE